MYLMKLRYEGYFGQRAGACWRLIFMHALMPWLDKYRILARPEEADDDKKAELEEKYPSLTFVSLHNVYAEIGGDAGNEDLTEDHEDEDSNEAIPSRSVLLTGRRRRSRQRSTNADEARMRMLEEEAKAQCIQISKLEEDCKSLEKGSEAKRHRIMKLEKEVKRLKAVLDTSIASEEPSHTNNNGNGGNDAREMEA